MRKYNRSFTRYWQELHKDRPMTKRQFRKGFADYGLLTLVETARMVKDGGVLSDSKTITYRSIHQG